MSFYQTLNETKKIILNLESADKASMAEEEKVLLTSKKELSPLEFLKLENKIEVQRALRQNYLNELYKAQAELEKEVTTYLNALRLRSNKSYKTRYDMAWKIFESSRWTKKKTWAEPNTSVDDYIITFFEGNEDKPMSMNDAYRAWQYSQFPGDWREVKRSGSRVYYAMPRKEYFEKYIVSGKNWNWKKLATTKVSSVNSGEWGYQFIDQKDVYLLRMFRNQGYWNMGEFQLMGLLAVIQACFPRVDDYESNSSAYPYFIDFMEEVPWPTSEQMNEAIRKWMGIGSEEYKEANLKILETYADFNSRSNVTRGYSLDLPKNEKFTNAEMAFPDAQNFTTHYEHSVPEPHYGIPKMNPNYQHINYSRWNTLHPRGQENIYQKKAGSKEEFKAYVNDSIEKWKEWRKQFIGNQIDQETYEKELKAIEDRAAQAIAENNNPFFEPVKHFSAGGRSNELSYPGNFYAKNPQFQDWNSNTLVSLPVRPAHASRPDLKLDYRSQTNEPKIKFNDWPDDAKPHVSNDTAKDWYSPRPRPGFIYVPGFDYIDPALWTGAYTITYQSIYGAELERRRKLERMKAFNSFKKIIGKMGELARFVQKGVSAGTQLAIGTALVALTGGAAAGMVANISNVTVSHTNLGKTDIGKVLAKVGEAYAIANITDAAVEQIVRETLEREVISLAKKEIAQETGLDRTIAGRILVDVSVGTGYGMSKDKSFYEALTETADKSWRMEAAKESPVAAIIIAGATEIEMNNARPVDSDDPKDWFDNFSWENVSEGARNLVKSVDSDDVKRAIGLGLMVSAGYIDAEDAAGILAQNAAIRRIDSVYQDKPIYGPKPKSQIDYEAMTRDVNRWKAGLTVVDNIKAGKPPTKEQIIFISDDVAGPLYDNIKSLGVPTSFELKLWDVALNDVGIPNIAQYVPDVDVQVPDWMKTKKGSTPFPKISRAEVEKKIGKKLDLSQNLTREDFIQIVLDMLPKETALVPIARTRVVPSFNFQDLMGNIYIRPPLKFPYDHPMIQTGLIQRRYTEKQKQYMLAREAEMAAAKQRMDAIRAKIEELESYEGAQLS